MPHKLVEGQSIGNYKVVGTLRLPGLGEVYKAGQGTLERAVVLWPVPVSIREASQAFARLSDITAQLADLRQSGIAEIMDHCTHDGGHYLVYAYLEPASWPSLADVLRRKVRLEVGEAVEVAQRLLKAMAAAHQRGLVHGGLDAECVWLHREGEINIVNFGLDTRHDERRDLTDIGLLMYTMLTGALPYEAVDMEGARARLQDRPLIPPRIVNPAVPEEIQTVVLRCLEQDPETAYASAQAALDELRAHLRMMRLPASGATRVMAPPSPVDSSTGAFVLECMAQDNGLRVGWKGPDNQTITAHDLVEISFDQLRAWREQVATILRQATQDPLNDVTSTGIAGLRRLGQLMYDQLLPHACKLSLREHDSPYLVFHLDNKTVRFPWELLHDGEAFLCLRFACGRTVSTDQQPDKRRPCMSQEGIRFLVLGNPGNDLPTSAEECHTLRASLLQREDIRLRLRMTAITRETIQQDLRETDILHYSGHARYDAEQPGQSGWMLTNGLFSARDVQQLRGAASSLPRIVFANACQSAVLGEDRPHAADGEFSMANAFLLAGVPHYIGAFADVQDAPAGEFSLVFYKQVLEGQSLGLALLAARRHVMERWDEGCLLWASYVMYGDPTATLASGMDAAPSASPFTAQAHQTGASDAGRPAATTTPVRRRWRPWHLAAPLAMLIGFVWLAGNGLAPWHMLGPSTVAVNEPGPGYPFAANPDQDRHARIQSMLDRLVQAAPRETTDQDAWSSRVLGLAVLPFRVTGGSDTEGIDAGLRARLSRDARLHLVDRRQLDNLLLELRLDQDDLLDRRAAVQVGHLLSARVILTGDLIVLLERTKVVMEVIDTETSKVIAIIEQDTREGVDTMLDRLIDTLRADIEKTYPIRGLVTSRAAEGLELNIGERHGLAPGMLLDVFDTTGLQQTRLGRARVARIDTHASWADIVEADAEIYEKALVQEAPSE